MNRRDFLLSTTALAATAVLPAAASEEAWVHYKTAVKVIQPRRRYALKIVSDGAVAFESSGLRVFSNGEELELENVTRVGDTIYATALMPDDYKPAVNDAGRSLRPRAFPDFPADSSEAYVAMMGDRAPLEIGA